jgi:hypothetical protein
MRHFITTGDREYGDLRGVIIMTAWYIWWIRQQKVHVEVVQPVSRMVMLIQVLAANFVRAATTKKKEKKSSWARAGEGFVSVNVDAAFNIQTRRGSGVVIRDDKGNF